MITRNELSGDNNNADNSKLKTEAVVPEVRKEWKSSYVDYKPAAKKVCLKNVLPSTSTSPKKRLHVPGAKSVSINKAKVIYRYGNYSRYYGYRNTKDFHDVRLDVFAKHKDLFEGKDILDIGCNSGLVTMSIAKDFLINHITGMDIDKSLANQARKFLKRQKKEYVSLDKTGFPFNTSFVHGNYVVRDPILLEVEERYHFDLILCLSVTKWIHLNFGDEGLKLAFKRMFRQLKSGGRLILEPQPWNSYKRRKKITADIEENFKGIAFYPSGFTSYLLGKEVGFCEMYELEQIPHSVKGFQRPLQVFVKK